MKNIKQIKQTLIIGIPAFNEGANIKYLLQDLLKQDTSGVILKKIIVSSDGSTDKTVSLVKNYKNNKVIVIDNKKRHGLSNVQNQIFEKSNSDILVLLNADIMIKDKKFIEELIKPILEKKAELTCSATRELESTTFISEVLSISMKFKTSVFEKYKNGHNIYTCHVARAFSKKLYKKMKFKDSIGEDAYSYSYTIFNKNRYKYINSTKAFYRLPTNFQDHERQSIRFLHSKNNIKKEFGDKFVKENYYLPTKLLAIAAIQFVLKYPIYMFSYFMIYSGVKLKSLFVKKINDKWEISKSSKVLRVKPI